MKSVERESKRGARALRPFWNAFVAGFLRTYPRSGARTKVSRSSGEVIYFF